MYFSLVVCVVTSAWYILLSMLQLPSMGHVSGFGRYRIYRFADYSFVEAGYNGFDVIRAAVA